MMNERKLKREENVKTKILYHEIFAEDSLEFLDYYYACRARENEIYTIEDDEGEIISMIHLNPYQLRLGECCVNSRYMIAVATQEKYRHQGMMTRLLRRSLQEMRKAGEPFVFLMPAAEAIYTPFDFRFIYEQAQCTIRPSDFKGQQGVNCRPAKEEDMEALAQFSNEYLSRYYSVYVLHTADYFKILLKEQNCQNGEVVLILDKETICGYFFTAIENQAEVREAVAKEGYEQFLFPAIADYLSQYEEIQVFGGGQAVEAMGKRVSAIMGRIVEPTSFVQGMRAEEAISFVIEIKDELLPENAGIYEFRAGLAGASMERIQAEKADVVLGIGELTRLFFGCMTMKEAGASEEICKKWEQVYPYHPVFLNEIV